ncbi:hypothetical protein B0J12DRAFT_741284 [Macrophomina phaseolina]|uniref:Uncharacterized protein n=1 Tax=Macrophomina phaseolina TaxID=35725 RepID=A0ABQ8G7H9_9PEZI|nr:hypothetical protein B0J12DRAFT_741284 [Macrophomina phaseolina]
MDHTSLRSGYGPVSPDDSTTLQGVEHDRRRGSTETDSTMMFGTNALKEASSSVMNPMAAPSGRTSMSTTRTTRAIEHFDGNPNIPPYESIAEDPEYNRGGPRRMRGFGPGWTHLLDRWNAWWVGETIAALLSLGCLAVVIWILVDIGSDGTRLSDWTLAVQPSTLVSVFINASRFLILFVVAECVGQFRWLCFQRGARPLDELELFDSASRGAVGSAFFVLKMRAKALLASVGALVIIFALAMDPFAQQVLRTETRMMPVAGAANGTWMPAARRYDTSSSILTSNKMRKSIYGGLLDFETEVEFGCLTGNCTWDAFTSLGLCSSCQDLSNTITPICSDDEGSLLNGNCSQLTYTLSDYNLTLVLQNGSFIDPQDLNNTDTSPRTNVTDHKAYTLVKSVAGDAHPGGLKDPRLFQFAVAQLLVGSTAGLTYDSEDLQRPSWNITACAVSWCAKVYEDVEVKSGTLINSSPRAVSLTASTNSSCWSSTGCQEFVAAAANSSAVLPEHDANATFYIGGSDDSISVRHIMDFDYNITVSNDTSSSASEIDDAYTLATTIMWNINITAAFSHISTSMTNYIRSSPASSSSSSSSDDASRVLGTPYSFQTFIVVSWAWFALPAAVVGTGVLLLIVCAVLSTRRRKEGVLWKTSVLPLLLMGPPKGAWREEEWRKGRGRGRVGAVVGGMTARLRADERGVVRFVGGGGRGEKSGEGDGKEGTRKR